MVSVMPATDKAKRNAEVVVSSTRVPKPVAVLPLETGFESPGIAVVGEQDILGDRLVRPRRKARSAVEPILTDDRHVRAGDAGLSTGGMAGQSRAGSR